ncbi:MAG: DNA primase [Candidatus Fluviicola riflensis]|nr:MAG: DNA primase [Candidatus Fluviicola riflensis]OGS78850.1 MAG: DNA primase [Candidatus Fluviicola riflensis]OGS85872.1 MAG: DNA primase [Fluviicola sp. RIFCSPHIGHO2_12_FULL_43_24]OGS86281.1 MAG: DNA primase [Fluviicola sp. RIFCSPHIGHO2_01_FULL_43_53]
MSRIPAHIVDEIMQTSRIEEVIGEFVNLKRSGSNLKGLSPFVDEKTPSFMVSPAKQIFKCFSSGKGGSVVTFLMEKEHFSYPEALRWLADKYGVQVPEDEPQTAEEIAAITERESLYIINEFAKEHFMHNMHEVNEGQTVGLSYFEERGFRPDIVKKFQLGYCLNSGNDFTKHALEKGYKLEYLESVGLVKSKDDRHFDFFRGRVMFPIHSISGRVLGFGGRTLFTDKKVAKYFNSPESIIYNKSEILYGLYFAKGDIVKYDNCYLCEGYTDVISMHQAGVANSVSSSGTSLTSQQIKLIKRYTPNITILYDGDAAGIKASFRGIDLILEEGMNVKIVLFPDGDDPDSYSKKVSSTEFMDFIKDNTQDFLSFKTSMLLKEGKTDPIQRAGMIREVVLSISLIPDQITRSIYIKEVAKQFELEESLVVSELNKLLKNKLAKELNEPQIAENPSLTDTFIDRPEQQVPEIKPLFSIEEYDLLRILVKYGQFAMETEHLNEHGIPQPVEVSVAELICHELDKDQLFFAYPLFNKIHGLITEGLTQKTLYKTSYWLKNGDQEIVQFVTGIETEEHEISPLWLSKYSVDTNREIDKLKDAVMGAIYAFKSRAIQNRIGDIRKELETVESENMERINDLISEQIILERVKQSIAVKLGRIITH